MPRQRDDGGHAYATDREVEMSMESDCDGSEI